MVLIRSGRREALQDREAGRRCRCAAIMPRDPTFLSSGTLSEVEVQALRLGERIPPASALASGKSAMYHWVRVTRVALAQWGHP